MKETTTGGLAMAKKRRRTRGEALLAPRIGDWFVTPGGIAFTIIGRAGRSLQVRKLERNGKTLDESCSLRVWRENATAVGMRIRQA